MTCARLRRVALVILGAPLAFVVLPAPGASAHAVFVAARPAPGARLASPPASVRMVFSEPLDASLSGIGVYTSAAHRVTSLAGSVDPGDPRAYELVLPRLRPDRYAVVWHTVSAIDGHSRRGSYTFTVDRRDGSAPPVRSTASPESSAGSDVPTPAQAAAMWFGLAGLFLLTGSVLADVLGAGTGVLAVGTPRRRLLQLLVAGCAGLAVGTVGELICAWAPAGWRAAALGDLLSGSVGRWWEMRLAAAALALVAWRWPGRRVVRGLTGGVGAGVAAYSFAATSHGAAAARATTGLAFEFVHILAASVWLGGAVAVAVVWAAARRAAVGDRRMLLRRYSLAAGVAVPAVLVSGLGNAVVEVGRVGDLVSSSYGWGLLLKLVVAFVLLGVALLNALLWWPSFAAGRPRGERLGRTIAIEAGLGLAVLVPTAVLGVLAPSRPTDSARTLAQHLRADADPAREFSGSTRLAGRDAEVGVTPGAVGVNAVRVEVAGVDPAARLRLATSSPGGTGTVVLKRTGRDDDTGIHTIYQGTLQVGEAGTWQLILGPAGGTGGSAPIVLPVSVPALDSLPTSSAPGSWLALIALAGIAAAVAAGARAVPGGRGRRAMFALGAGGLVAAVAWGGTLATGPPARPSAAAGWGQARTVPSATPPGARLWRMPRPEAGVMMPAIAPDGSVWVAEMNANKLARLDPARNVVREFSFPGGYRETMGVAVAADGRVWLAQEHAMVLGVFDPVDGRYREFRIPGGVSAPVGITVAPGGDVWFTEMSGDRIGRFDPRTSAFRQYRVPTPAAAPYWLTSGPTGRIWFTEFGTGKVGVLDPRTGRIREYAVPGRPNVPGIAVARNGTVWLTTIQGSLFGLTPRSGRFRRIALPAGGDYGLAVAPDGIVWVGRDGGRAMYAVDPATGRVHSCELPAGSAPWWPVVDRRGRVWVALAGRSGNGLAEVLSS